ncbi:MAG: DUF302 domain-containing protein [Terriglobales bacterium]|jgi:uncharacterized protein (DUF302 family)
MKNFQYTVSSNKTFDAAVSAVERTTAEKGFRVLHTHDVAATLAEKSFAREPLKIVEVCNARYADDVLKRDVKVAVMLPCRIAIYAKDGATFISTMRPSAIADFYPDVDIANIAAAIEKTVLEIVDEAK